MVRSIDGQGLLDDEQAAGAAAARSLPSLSTTVGHDAEERQRARSRAWSAMAPGSGVIMIAPVSVCHQVSTIGQRPPPITSWYHIHASGLIGSPTVPSRRRRERSCFFGHCVAPAA